MYRNHDIRPDVPWYKRTFRWGQTNLTEMDPITCHMDWWRNYWHETRVQGVIVNAGGIVAYYPSSFTLQYRAAGLEDHDLLGEFITAAKEEGLTVLARMDVNRATQEFYDAHPDWFVVNADGMPLTTDGRYFSCVNSDYYKKYIPDVLKEIIACYHPDGFSDNSWTGVRRQTICHCGNCKQKFREECGSELPVACDWNDPIYQKWIRWSYKCRMENWDLFNEISHLYGGPDCLWTGMVNANPINNSGSFCDLKGVCQRSEIIMCDHQSREEDYGFEENGLNGGILHGIMGWDKLIAESMANYVRGIRSFRRSSNPTEETRHWMVEGFSGGISPWYHHVGATQEDRRQFHIAPPVMQWHEKNEKYLYNRIPVANVGLVWSQDDVDFYGRDDVHEKVTLPWLGYVKALTRARIPFIPVHADDIAKEAENLNVLILPELAAMSDTQCLAVIHFVEAGGSLIFTGASALYDESGRERRAFPLEAVTGIRHLHKLQGAVGKQSPDWTNFITHNYIRLPKDRHEVFDTFEDTDILPFGGSFYKVEAEKYMKPVATYVPAFPIYPPEFSWMREPYTDIPVLFAGEHPSGGRIFYFAGDVDRCYGRTGLPDHGDLLANTVRWASNGRIPLKVEGPGYIDCKLYRQDNRFILHLINLSGCNRTGYLEEYLPVGPVSFSIKTDLIIPSHASLRVSGKELEPKIKDSWATFQIDKIINHEMAIIE